MQIMSTEYIVYELWNPLKNEPFYVGKTKNKSRRLQTHLYEATAYKNKTGSYKRYNSIKCNIILKILKAELEVEFKIVYTTTDEEDALIKERQLISLYGRKHDNTGILSNLTSGGEGYSGYVAPKELRILQSKQRSGALNAMYGKNHTKEARNKISKIMKEKFASGERIPTQHTTTHKQNMRDNNKGGQATAIPVVQICTNTGNIIKFYKSARTAGIELANKLDARANINLACNIKYKTAYGFYWRYVDDPELMLGQLNVIQLNKRRLVTRASKKTVQLDENKNIIKIWESASDACRHYGLDVTTLRKYLKTGKKRGNFYWQYMSTIK